MGMIAFIEFVIGAICLAAAKQEGPKDKVRGAAFAGIGVVLMFLAIVHASWLDWS